MNRKDLREKDRRLDTAIDKQRAEIEATRQTLADLEAVGVAGSIDAEERRLSRLAAARSVLKAQEAELQRLEAEERDVTRQIDEARIGELRAEFALVIDKNAAAIVALIDDIQRGLVPIENEIRSLGGDLSSPRNAMLGSLRQAAVVSGLYENTVTKDGMGIRRRA